MSDWGVYSPDNFGGFPPSDQASVSQETRKQYALALFGVPEAYAALKGDQHFWGMSVPMRAVFAKMPARYPYYLAAYTGIAPAPPLQQPGPPPPPAGTAQGPVQQERALRTTANRSGAKNVARSAGGPSSTLRAMSVSTNGTLEDVGSLADVDEKSPTKGSRAARTRRASTPQQTPAARKTMLKKKARRAKRGGSVFDVLDPRKSSIVDLTNFEKLQGKVGELKTKTKACKSWRLAFKMALCGLFTYGELKTCTATQADSDRLKLAAELARDFCLAREDPVPTIIEFHGAYSAARRSVRPYL